MTLPFLLGAAALLAALAPLLGRVLGREAGWPLAAGLAGLGVWLLVAVPPDGRSVRVDWLPSLGVSFALRLDGLGQLFAILVLVIGGAVLAYSCRYFDRGPHADFYGLMTLFSVGMLGLVLADDVVVMLVMWEVTTICSFFLISRSGPKGQASAARTLLVTVGGGLALLAAVVVMIAATGTSQLSAILASPLWGSDPAFATTVGLLIAVAAFTKSAQFPFHGWLPDSMVAATPISAYLHAAAMVKAGIYLLMRFSPALGETLAWNVTLVVVGLLTAVMGALFALQRSDLKELLAYSTVSQLGLLVATIGLGTREALSAAVVHTVAHALFKGALFMLIGVVDHQAGTREVDQLSGLRRSMPFTTAGVVLACLSMAGVPPLLGFISKEKILAAMWDAPGPGWVGPTAALVAVAASVLTLAYTGRILLGAFFGPTLDPAVREGSPAFLAPVLVLAAAGLVLGPGADLIEPTVTAAADAAAALPVGETALYLWPGFVPELYLSAASIVLGLLAIRSRHRVDALLDRPLFPGTAVGALLALRAGAIALGGRVGDLTRADTVRRHLAPPVLAVVALGVLGLVALVPGVDLAAATAASRASDVALVVLIGVGVLGVVVVRSRLAAVAVLGVVGFTMSLWFLALGAADAALTQLLVEVLTVAVAVLVLRRLPRRFHPQRRARTIAAACAALGAGAAAFVGVLALTGRPGISPVGAWYLERAEPETGGTNVVNTILVDFRALDTFGELVVLGTAGLAVLVVLEVRRLVASRRPRLAVPALSPSRFAWDNAVYARVTARALVPLMLLLSLFFLVRGHDEPGGGFNAALTGTAAFVLRALAASSDREGRSRLPAVAMVAGGLLVCVVSGLAGFADGAFLRPLSSGISVLGVSLTSALAFDVGVYLVVMGAVVAALDRLGPLGSSPPDEDEDEPGTGSRRDEVGAAAGGDGR
ncbi:DUF4040 family protein [Actinomycetospora soli]|uniref:DUF4040 family protein n=1 Tax=Actinomycetospora soli TaxID=2893887 RepID=UPI001E2B1924|nr:DUF4040 family protein [Actinomycetospora soli]MCD2190871.1 DUF4040 family protein [Actinomycetospora soli]